MIVETKMKEISYYLQQPGLENTGFFFNSLEQYVPYYSSLYKCYLRAINSSTTIDYNYNVL